MKITKMTNPTKNSVLRKCRQQLRIFLCAGLFCLLCCVPQLAVGSDLDQLLSTLIVGTWEEGNVPYGTVAFSADGTYQAKMFSTNNKATLLSSFAGTWKIINSELQSVLTVSNSPMAPVGRSFADRIVQINQNELILIDVNGKRYIKHRVTEKN